MNSKEKSLGWVVNQIPDFDPKSNEEKMLFNIKRYCQAGADEIKRLEAENEELKREIMKNQTIRIWSEKDAMKFYMENEELRARLDKAVELPCIQCVMTVDKFGNAFKSWALIYKNRCDELVFEPCINKEISEERLAELKGDKK